MKKKPSQIYNLCACGKYYTLTIVSKGKTHFCFFDAGDLAIVERFIWCFSEGYAQAKVPKDIQHLYKTKLVLMHRLILKPEAPLVSDHISGDKLDNRRVNLRAVPENINCRNRLKQANTFSKFKGVTNSGRIKNPFLAQIKFNKKNYNLGRFPSAELAALAYNKKALANGFILKYPNKDLELQRAAYI